MDVQDRHFPDNRFDYQHSENGCCLVIASPSDCSAPQEKIPLDKSVLDEDEEERHRVEREFAQKHHPLGKKDHEVARQKVKVPRLALSKLPRNAEWTCNPASKQILPPYLTARRRLVSASTRPRSDRKEGSMTARFYELSRGVDEDVLVDSSNLSHHKFRPTDFAGKNLMMHESTWESGSTSQSGDAKGRALKRSQKCYEKLMRELQILDNQ
ncbi:hypothetical protein GUITHDRAFT_111248 [Guillardia theta CCMP2712]|uniref:Uncharacterized protein n=1 Tax=Guillardia theta (strain CCMP2712) TaxID=905079 RepID=L1J3K5_GUITC|nr:hypothetical protein GUITHDRAFT_111248 [Guillardia theta CCMP2712]EKX42882.1 hypothetical protein GUITHDRAFT_111248 [Guillardia theta CCMP2712]|eukprot:XP_005829862.1 hypothetical protein GUITHDRAFT_111248 [Guillardia theta CCMP2712]